MRLRETEAREHHSDVGARRVYRPLRDGRPSRHPVATVRRLHGSCTDRLDDVERVHHGTPSVRDQRVGHAEFLERGAGLSNHQRRDTEADELVRLGNERVLYVVLQRVDVGARL